MPAVHSQTSFLWGFSLGLSASALLFYIWHTESLIQLQQNWLSQLEAQQQNTQQSAKSNLETIDLLMKSYSITDGSEDQDMRAELIRNQHLALLQQVQQDAGVDISDLLDPARPFNSAQLYAALLRIKQQHERKSARQQLDQQVALPETTVTPTRN
jgi:hypothetical protein